jgi:hypothetical protein
MVQGNAEEAGKSVRKCKVFVVSWSFLKICHKRSHKAGVVALLVRDR